MFKESLKTFIVFLVAFVVIIALVGIWDAQTSLPA